MEAWECIFTLSHAPLRLAPKTFLVRKSCAVLLLRPSLIQIQDVHPCKFKNVASLKSLWRTPVGTNNLLILWNTSYSWDLEFLNVWLGLDEAQSGVGFGTRSEAHPHIIRLYCIYKYSKCISLAVPKQWRVYSSFSLLSNRDGHVSWWLE